MAKKTIKKNPVSTAPVTPKAPATKASKVRVYSRDRSLVRVIIFSEDEVGDFVEETKIIKGNEFLELEVENLGWDIANKVKSGLLRIRTL